MAQRMDSLVSTPTEGPAWKQRAVERSTRAAKLRAERIDPRVPWLYGFELDFRFR